MERFLLKVLAAWALKQIEKKFQWHVPLMKNINQRMEVNFLSLFQLIPFDFF